MIMAASNTLKVHSFHLLELDLNEDLMWVWSYPSIEPEEKTVFLRKISVVKRSGESDRKYKYYKFNHQWFYFVVLKVSSNENLPDVNELSLIVTAGEFNPARYEALCDILSKSYLKHGKPEDVLRLFLSVMATGKCNSGVKGEVYRVNDFNERDLYPSHDLKAIINRFGMETMLIYAALVRKRRIVIYHHDIDILIQVVLSVPFFVTHIQFWDCIFPWVDLNPDEILQFQESKFHIVGCTNAAIENLTDIYDVFINVPAAEIFVASHAKESLMMNKSYKEVATFMMTLTEQKEVSIGDELWKKTQELGLLQ